MTEMLLRKVLLMLLLHSPDPQWRGEDAQTCASPDTAQGVRWHCAYGPDDTWVQCHPTLTLHPSLPNCFYPPHIRPSPCPTATPIPPHFSTKPHPLNSHPVLLFKEWERDQKELTLEYGRKGTGNWEWKRLRQRQMVSFFKCRKWVFQTPAFPPCGVMMVSKWINYGDLVLCYKKPVTCGSVASAKWDAFYFWGNRIHFWNSL